MEKDYTKLGGWLIFFLVVQIISGVMVLQESMSIMSQVTIGGSLVEVLLTLSTVSAVGAIAMGIAGVVMKKIKWIHIHFILSGSNIVITALMLYIVLGQLSAYTVGNYRNMAMLSIIRSIIALIVWIQVFRTSPRAKVYFGLNEGNIEEQTQEE